MPFSLPHHATHHTVPLHVHDEEAGAGDARDQQAPQGDFRQVLPHGSVKGGWGLTYACGVLVCFC